GAQSPPWHHETSIVFAWATHQPTLPQCSTPLDRFRAVAAKKRRGATNPVELVAQFIAVCRRSKMMAMSTRRPRRGARLCRRWALKWREGGQLLGQCLRATKCDKLSEIKYGVRGKRCGDNSTEERGYTSTYGNE